MELNDPWQSISSRWFSANIRNGMFHSHKQIFPPVGVIASICHMQDMDSRGIQWEVSQKKSLFTFSALVRLFLDQEQFWMHENHLGSFPLTYTSRGLIAKIYQELNILQQQNNLVTKSAEDSEKNFNKDIHTLTGTEQRCPLSLSYKGNANKSLLWVTS